MKKMTLEFQIETVDDEKSAKRALSADNVYCALWDIRQQIFRPARKHGYSEHAIASLFDEETHGKLIEALETKFYEILTGHEISLDDLS